MTRRRLRPDELALWQQIARSADPLHRPKKPHPDPPAPPRKPDPESPARRDDPLPPFAIGQSARDRSGTASLPPGTSDRLKAAPVRMDNRAYGKLRRGKLKPDARIDLHGLTLDEAHPRLTRFILDAQTRGHRLVLVITGKGDREDPYAPMPQRRGILKRQVPLWLQQAPLGSCVLQVNEAHIRHGGAGAYYVYLRKRR